MFPGVVTRSRALSQRNIFLTSEIESSEQQRSFIPTLEMADVKGNKIKKQLGQMKTAPNEVTPQTWINMFMALNTTLKDLKTEIADLKGLKGTVDNFIDWKTGVDQSMHDTEAKVETQDFKIKLLTNIGRSCLYFTN